MSLFDRFKNKEDDRVEALNQKVADLEDQIQKSALNDSLVGIINSSWHEIITEAKQASYGAHYAIYRGIDMLSSLISQPTPRIERGDELLPQGTILPGGFDILQPNPNYTFRNIQYRGSVYMFYRGEYMIYINTEISSTPILEVLNPKHMEREDLFTWYNTEQKRKYKDEDIIYVELFNPDGDRGLSPVEVIAAEVKNDLSALEYGMKFFENFGRVGGTLSSKDKPITEENMKKIVGQFNQAHASSKNAYKTLGLPTGLEYKELQQTMAEMQFRESRGDIRDRVLQVLGIHKALFGVTDQVNRSVSEEASRNLWVFTLIPKLRMIEEAYNQKLFKRFFPGYEMSFDTSSIPELKENMETMLTVAKGLRDLGYNLNEIAAYLELMPQDIENDIGEARFVPSTVVPYELVDATAVSEESKGLDKEDQILKLLDNDEEKAAAQQNLYTRFIAVNNIRASKFKKKLRNYWASELGDVIKVVLSQKNLKATEDINAMLAEIQNTLNANKPKMIDKLQPEYEKTSVAGDKFALGTLKDSSVPAARNDIVNDMVNKVTGITDETYKALRKTIKDSVNEGATIDQIADKVRAQYKINNKTRAVIIARTETANMLNRSADARYKEAGVKQKQWLAVGDGNTRDAHLTNYQMGRVAYDYTYPNGQQYPGDGRGGPENNINCRCAIQPIVGDN